MVGSVRTQEYTEPLLKRKRRKRCAKFSCEDDNSAEFFQEEILLDIIKYII